LRRSARQDARTGARLWDRHHVEFRDPHQVVSHWDPEPEVDPRLLRHTSRGRFWEILEATGGTLIVTREYEHLVVALSARDGRRRVSHLRLPHPNGLAVHPRTGRLYVASTRNPNVVLELAPLGALMPRDDRPAPAEVPDVLHPVRGFYLPGCLYVHDLAFLGGRLHATAVGMNAIVELADDGGFRPVWWPRCIDGPRGPRFDRNYLQLNSIAAGRDLASSFFAASTACPSSRRPGHLNFPVDRQGVIFSGRTREVVAGGLTRPHSARLQGRTLWVDNSGYGELGHVEGGRFEPLLRLPGWTRGLLLRDRIAFVGTSRILPRFRHYAPGLDPARCEAGVHAVDLQTGRILGSLVWPLGNQIFGIELVGPSNGGARLAPSRRSHAGEIFSRGLVARPGKNRRPDTRTR
jgi:uncharacterized protein (TIGR03032 family)